MSFQIKTEHTNYLAKIVKLPAPRKHSNADKLQCVLIDGNNVITGLTAKEGDLYIYFPLESSLNPDYLKWSNSYSSAEKNADTTKKGFFNNAGRVKAVKLRGEPSCGYIIPASDLVEWLGSIGKDATIEEGLGVEFSHFGDILICEKYIVKPKHIPGAARQKQPKRESKIVDNQFRLHIDTAPLKKNVQLLNPDDTITISYKMHGTSGVFSKLLCKKPLKWHEKILSKLGVNIVNTQYDYIYSSRKVIKNGYADKVSDSYYDMDVWALTNERYKESVKEGVSIYGEIVNQLPNGKWIQKDFDYGLAPATSDLFVYRITYTSPVGDVLEFTTSQIKQYCAKYNLKTVPIFYHGKAKDWDSSIDTANHWHENFLAKLIEKYNEKDCYMCKSKVPEEGIVLTREGEFFEPFKLKSFRFLEKESAELDKGEVNIEDSQSVEVTNEV